MLLEREGECVNCKRLYRVYREAGLCLKREKRKHCVLIGVPLRQLAAANQKWALDFAHDVVAAGRTIRVLSVIDAFTRECLALEVDTGAPAAASLACWTMSLHGEASRKHSLRQRPGTDQPSLPRLGLEWKIELRHI
jgi:transposase InsO family protein